MSDLVQMSVVLRHLQKYRPNWIVDYQCRKGGHQCGVGLVNAIFTDDEPAAGKYHQVIEFTPHDALYNFDDRPNTKVTSTLHEQFGLPWDAELGRYVVPVPDTLKPRLPTDKPFVILHYQGHSSGYKKDLEEWQAKEICAGIIAAGRAVVIIDRDARSPLPDGKTIVRVSPEGVDHLAAVIGMAEAMVGIDSGPGHVAGATDTPTLICWIKNHPVHFYDPAPNVTHLVPHSHRGLPPAHDDGVFDFFQKHYRYDTYLMDEGLVSRVYHWLEWALNLHACGMLNMPPLKFIVRDNMASVCWAMTKIRSVAGGRPIEVIVDCKRGHSIVKEFLERLPFIRKVSEIPSGLQPPDKPTNTRGHHIFSATGRDFDGHFRLVPDTFVEDGRGIRAWLPEYDYDTHWQTHLPADVDATVCAILQRGLNPLP